jgi:hypothetical protein
MHGAAMERQSRRNRDGFMSTEPGNWGWGDLGVTRGSLDAALAIKQYYGTGQPICVPGDQNSILVPEHLLNHNLNLKELEDPLALAMVAARAPESPMAMTAAARLSPKARKPVLAASVFDLLAEASRHHEVRSSIELVTANAFSPPAIGEVRRRTSKIIVETRRRYTVALRENLNCLLDGSMTPRGFVREFFHLTEAGNLRNDIRTKRIVSLLMSESIRPSIKFLLLENFERMPKPVRMTIIGAVLEAKPTHHVELIKEELRWIVAQADEIPGRGH